MAQLTDTLYEPKLVYYSKSFDDTVRTFCVAPYGQVITESYDGVLTVNGQSYAEKKTENTNFAILVTTSFTEPFKEPIAYGKYVARLGNLLSGGVIGQRLGDLEAGRRSTHERIARSVVTPTLKNATPGDLSFVLPYRYLADIREMLQALDKLAPGLHSADTLLYGAEIDGPAAAAQPVPDGHSYLASFILDPGNYTLKLAAVDDVGRRGSVEHAFEAKLTAAGQLRLGDLMLADMPARLGREVRPSVDTRMTSEQVVGYVELTSEVPAVLDSAEVVLQVAPSA